jgi:hypothetical protein
MRILREISLARFPTIRSFSIVTALMLAILIGLGVSEGFAKEGHRDQLVPPIVGISTTVPPYLWGL